MMDRFNSMKNPKKLLILGCGGHGRAVAEVALDCGYTQVAFLDDNDTNALGKIEDMDRYVSEYPVSFVGIGNAKLRNELLQRLERLGYEIATLIHPTAYVSRSAVLGKGTVVEPHAIVNTGTSIGCGGILSVGSIVDHDAKIGVCCQIDTGAIVKSGGFVGDFMKIEAGQVVPGYEAVRV